VSTNQKIVATFDQAMDGMTIDSMTFTLTGPGVTPVSGGVSYDAASNSATFAPSAPLPAGTTYTGTITTGAASATGVALVSDFVWTFVSGAGLDTTTPTVISTNPANLAPDAPTNQKIVATFSEAMDSTTITGMTFALTGPLLAPVTGTVAYSAVGASATFTPAAALTAGVLYTATITTGASDLAGNSLASAYTWTFTAGTGPDTVAPDVTLTTPGNGDIGVAPNAGINATFSKRMNPSTLNSGTFTLIGPGPTPIEGKISYDVANRIVTITPRSPLSSDAIFTATVSTGAEDLEGNPLAADVSWILTTGSTDSPAPVDLGAANGFAIIAQATVTNAGLTVVNPDLGLTPGVSVTGFPVGVVNGTIQIGTPPAIAALASLGSAYADAGARPGATIIAANLAGQILTPGIYTSAATSFAISGADLTLDAQGDANAVWIFQIPASTLTLTAPGCSVILINGAQFANVFWLVGSSATIAAACELNGNVLADTTVTLAAGANVHGRVLAGAVTATGAVTLSTNTVSAAGACSQ
jgi:Ice-binding-like/Bacterial Ig-like domain